MWELSCEKIIFERYILKDDQTVMCLKSVSYYVLVGSLSLNGPLVRAKQGKGGRGVCVALSTVIGRDGSNRRNLGRKKERNKKERAHTSREKEKKFITGERTSAKHCSTQNTFKTLNFDRNTVWKPKIACSSAIMISKKLF